MATGSGKTLVMHINYWQILNYTKNFWDNIILITPNEGLSKQHYEELTLSGIPCKLYDGNFNNLKTKPNEILIIEISKLTEEKKGEGLSVDISFFDGKNLVFIDEGHKGQKSEERTWKRLREEIGKDGTIYVGSADRKLYAIYPNGILKWTFETEGSIWSSPVIGSDGTIYVGSIDGRLYAIYVYGSSALADTPWPMFRHDPRHSGRVEDWL